VPFGIDLAGKLAFVRATNCLPRAPLARLLRLRSVYRKWSESLHLIHPLSAAFHRARVETRPVGSPEAVELEHAINRWMKNCHFVDPWIKDLARVTLHMHDLGLAQPGKWYADEALWWNELHPKVPPLAPQGGLEQLFEYEARAREHFRKVRAARKLVPLITGARKQNQERDARWTALRFDGKSYSEIAKTEEGEGSVDEDTIQKSVTAFARRVGLTLSV
jgi:hypothetical protein